MKKEIYEKLDLFFLGEELDATSEEKTGMPLLLKSSELTTHAAIIGMTGSGKTGLGIGLIEEATLDGIPSIIIDPKGDMSNLLLSFPELKAADFEPWMDPSDAARKNLTIPELALETAQKWEAGIRLWGQDPSRIADFKNKAEFEIFTPGHTAGTSISVLNQFEAPGQEILNDPSTLNSLINTTVSSLLALVDISTDPLQSREHILVSSILLSHWQNNQSLSMELLIGKIVSPDIQKIGVFPLETFYPQSKRMELAMSLNNILASPAFSAWTQGEPLDIEKLLFSSSGKPRVNIFSISHLSDAERMFFVTLLLNRFLAWMRRQKGSSSLKTLLYMDEVFGFFPPTSNPPSKKPMLLLLKQARAFGVGIVLATQNPVDLDYKGLSNIGSWFIGRLQTAQDQNRVMSGLASGSEISDENYLSNLLSSMKGRTFLLHSTKNEKPILFATRWVLSYLKGPVSLADIRKINPKPTLSESARATPSEKPTNFNVAQTRPILSPKLPQRFKPSEVPIEEPNLAASLAAKATVRFFDPRRKIDLERKLFFRIFLDGRIESLNWEGSEQPEVPPTPFLEQMPDSARFSVLPACVQELTSFREMEKQLSDYVYYHYDLTLLTQPELGLEAAPDESPNAFQRQIREKLRDLKNEEVEKVKTSTDKELTRNEKLLNTAMYRIEKEKTDVKTKSVDTALSFGVAVLGALFGNRTRSTTTISRSATGFRSAGRLMKEKGDVKQAEEKLLQLEEEKKLIMDKLEEQIHQIDLKYDSDNYSIEELKIKPRRQDIYDVEVFILWEPDLPGLK